MIENKTWMRKASSGEGEIFSQLWQGSKPKAVLQIAHGMGEYSSRYKDFAAFLAGKGYAVCAEDHAGHGSHAGLKGFFAEKNGWECVLKDMKALMDEASGRYPGLPVFLLGHSMGSFLARSYITRYGEGLSGCILSGTMGPNPALGVAGLLSSVQKKLKGPRSPAYFISNLSMGSYNKRIKNPVNHCAWLSTVDQVCIDYAHDENCGFVFTAGAYYDMFNALKEIGSPSWPLQIPKDLPVYFFAGDEDPVGDYGRGVEKVYQSVKAAGVKDVSLKLYKGGRHEMLNEENREEVYRDTLEWLEKHLK
ncbi:MAG: lysophospholipase [Treponema sp.]|jgi:alpha-beta hydrolase superfamily lysophospholipase|nr:lysophospholipase [Treponema sp.]